MNVVSPANRGDSSAFTGAGFGSKSFFALFCVVLLLAMPYPTEITAVFSLE